MTSLIILFSSLIKHIRGILGGFHSLTLFVYVFSQRCRVQTNVRITCGWSLVPQLFPRSIGWPCSACCATSCACARPQRPTSSVPVQSLRSSARRFSDISPPGTPLLKQLLNHSVGSCWHRVDLSFFLSQLWAKSWGTHQNNWSPGEQWMEWQSGGSR